MVVHKHQMVLTRHNHNVKQHVVKTLSIIGIGHKEVNQTLVRNSIICSVQWAQQTQMGLPPGHTFYRAMWVKVTDSKLEKPFVPDGAPFPFNNDGSFLHNDNKYWMEHIFTIFDEEE